jgi:hypothetical protein
MDDPSDRQATARKDAYLRELERRSLDTIMVYNPTDKDYLLEWDKHYHRVPSANKNMGFGNGKMELSRYLADKYAREMKNLMINEVEAKFMRKFKEEKELSGHKFRDKYEENDAALPLAPKTNDPERIKEIYNVIILGVVREYGMDQPETPQGEEIDTKTPEEKVLENMNRPYVETEEIPNTTEAETFTADSTTPQPTKTTSTWTPINKRKTKSAVSEISK